ncbi:LOW QUALITY PROTEIN: hypothetical protein ACHAXR_004391, partial [Thalassiosira sp. AJA248-18]
GAKSVLTAHQAELLCQVIIRADRANEGLTPSQIISKIQALNSALGETQAKNYFHRTFKKQFKGRIKSKAVKAQKTTSRRSQCTVAQQFRWRKTIDKAYKTLLERNTGTCRKQFLEHFIIGLDETNLQADADGDRKIIGEFGKKKHEKKVSDCRASATMCRTGTAGGNNGPTVFVMKGKKRRDGYDEKFLMDEGCAVGSSFEMTENAFMTEEAWLSMTPKLVEGYRNLPYIKENPQWWCLEIFDGFGPHLNNYEALKMREDAKILSIKEEGDSSQVNQAYDKEAARSDKRQQRQSLSYIRILKGSNNFVDQWSLVHTGVAAIRYTKENGIIWINSFIAVNLHPKFRLSFEDWCKKIGPHMQASDSFKLVTQDNVDEYTLLPAIWQAMVPEEKKKAVEIYRKHNSWSPDCLVELKNEFAITMKEFASGWPLITLHISSELPDEVAYVESRRGTATDGLSLWKLIPPGMEGQELFDHAIGFRCREYAKDAKSIAEHKLSDSLGIISPLKTGFPKHQQDFFRVDYHHVVERSLMDDVGGNVNLKHAAQAKLDNLGQVKSHSTFVNDPKRQERAKERAELGLSMGRVAQRQVQISRGKVAKERAQLVRFLIDGINMFKNNETGRPLTKNHIKAILLFAFDTVASKEAKKTDLLDQLVALNEADDENRIERTLMSPPPLPAPALPAQLIPEPTLPSEGVSGTADDSAATWLYHRCDAARSKIGTQLSALGLSLVVLNVLHSIQQNDTDYDYDGDDEQYCDVFINALNTVANATKVDNDFVLDLVGRTKAMLCDEDLTKDELKKFE